MEALFQEGNRPCSPAALPHPSRTGFPPVAVSPKNPRFHGRTWGGDSTATLQHCSDLLQVFCRQIMPITGYTIFLYIEYYIIISIGYILSFIGDRVKILPCAVLLRYIHRGGRIRGCVRGDTGRDGRRPRVGCNARPGWSALCCKKESVRG